MLFQNKNLNFKRLVSKKKTCFPRNNKCWSELGLLVPQIVDRIFLYNILSIIGYLVRSLTTNDIRTPFSSEIDSDRLRSTQSEQEHRRGMPVVTWRVNATYIFSFRLNSLVSIGPRERTLLHLKRCEFGYTNQNGYWLRSYKEAYNSAPVKRSFFYMFKVIRSRQSFPHCWVTWSYPRWRVEIYHRR